MQKIYMDAETYYDREYSLTKMTTIEYVLDPRFKVLGWSIAVDDQPAYWSEGEKLPDFDWANVEVIAHNYHFDGTILALHYDLESIGQRSCTLSMGRALLPVKSHSLANLGTLLNAGKKLDGLTEGASASDAKLIEYAIKDVEICREIYKKLRPGIPDAEMKVMDICLRWGTTPKLCVDIERMTRAADNAEAKRDELIAKSGINELTLSSNKMFPALLEELTIEVPMKPSPANGWPTPALSKNDAEFHAMIAKYPEYDHIWKGRIAAKSNIEYRRPRKLIEIGNLTADHLLPMPLKYYGAHTGRFSGTDSINVQNMPRGGEARKSIIAPEGHMIVVADSSQIELRLNAWFCDEKWILDELKHGDVYKKAAANQFNKPPEAVTKDERQFGKCITLGAGYGMGWNKFQAYCGAGPLGMAPIILSDEEAQTAIRAYRSANPNIVSMWSQCGQILKLMTQDQKSPFKCLTIAKNAILLPNGMALLYPFLSCKESDRKGEEWSYGIDSKTYIYGGKLLENIIQALARIVITDQLLEIEKQGIVTVSSTHDEIIAIAPEKDAQATFNEMIRIMSTPPAWCSDLSLAAEGGFDYNYSK